MGTMSIIKVSDAKTGTILRYEDEHGKSLAIAKNGHLHITPLGQSKGLVVKDNKLIDYMSQELAY